MNMLLMRTCLLVGALVSVKVAAHGLLSGIIIDGKFHQGYNPNFQYLTPPPTVIGWSIPEDSDTGYVSPSSLSTAEIICHKGATPAGTHATVDAGSPIELQWTVWPESHHGPVITYLANCNGPCESVDKTKLKFFKIAEAGLIDDSTFPGKWASDQMIANNNTAMVIIPSTIAPGNYVLRHEIIALHSSHEENGAQNYPQCINLEISGTGTDSPPGVQGEALYSPVDPGIAVDIYRKLYSYTIPGPPLYSTNDHSPAINGSTKAALPAPVKKLAIHYGNGTDTKTELFPARSSSASTQISSSTTAQHTSPTSSLPNSASSPTADQATSSSGSTNNSAPSSPTATPSCATPTTVTVTITPTVTVTINPTISSPPSFPSSAPLSEQSKKPCKRTRRRRA